MSGWLCGKGGNNGPIGNQPSPNQKPKDILSQAQKHFQFVFNELKQPILSVNMESIFEIINQSNQSNQKSFNEKIKYAYIQYRIGDKKSQQKVEKWMVDNQQLFEQHFKSIILNTQNPKNNEEYIGYYIYLALSLNLVNQDEINKYFKQYLKYSVISLLTKLNFLEVTKKYPKTFEIIKTHFSDNFNDYCNELNTVNFSPLSRSIIIDKLMLAITLKEINPDQWKNHNWKPKALQELKTLLSVSLPAPDQNNLFFFFANFNQRFIVIYLWQKLYPHEVPDCIENWFKAYLKVSENCMNNLELSQYTSPTIIFISLCFHQKICKKARQWTKNLKNHISKSKEILTKDSIKYQVISAFDSFILFSDFFNFNT